MTFNDFKTIINVRRRLTPPRRVLHHAHMDNDLFYVKYMGKNQYAMFV